MSKELVERREALRSLDRRLTALTVDIEHILDEANQIYIGTIPIGASFDIGTSEPEGQVLEELSEIAHELGTLVEGEVVPEVPSASGWSVTARSRIDELQALVTKMQRLVRAAFDETVAKLLPEIESQPLAELDVGGDELVAPGDKRERNRKLLVTAWTLGIALFFAYVGTVDMDAVAKACERPSPCEGDAPELALHPGGHIVVHRKTAACEDGVRVLFDRDGEFVERLQPGETSDRGWPKKPARNRAPCTDQASLRWTWVMGWKGD